MTNREAALKSCKDRLEHLENTPRHHCGKRQRQRAIELEKVKIEALRPVTREQVEKVWKGCKRCAATKDEAFNPGIAHNFSVFDDAIYYCDSDYGWEGESILFCPWCGMPLTDEAVDMVMERLEALKDGSTTD